MAKIYLLAALLFCFPLKKLFSQITLSTPNGSYSENFDGMGATGTSYPTGWTGLRYGGSGTKDAILNPAVSDGSSSSGGIYNVGTTGNSDRALGTLSSGTTVPAFGASFVNNTGSNIVSFSFSGYSEQWRSGTSNTTDETVIFEYSTDATSLNTGTWTAFPAMNLTEILTSTTTAIAKDGNATRIAISGTTPAINLPNGGTIWIRWRDNDDPGSDGMYALDDFTMSWTNSSVSNTVSITPGNNAAEPSTNGTFTVTSSTTAPAGGITINYTLSGTATAGSDYSNSSTGSVTIPEGSNTATITINTLDDNAIEPTETIIATLNSVTSPYTISTSSATISLFDNESTPLYSYDFSSCSGTLSDGFTQQSVAGAQVWSCTTFGNSGNGVQMDGYSSGNQTNEDWLISPVLDLSSTNIPLLSFYSRGKFAGEQLKLYITNNYTGDVSTTTWTELNGKFPAAGSDAWTFSDAINLSSFKQANVRIAFKYVSSTSAAPRWTLDDINIINSLVSAPSSLTFNGSPLLDFRNVSAGSTSSAKSFAFWGNNFTSDLTVTVPSGYQISRDNSAYGGSVSFTPSDLQGQQTIYIKYAPSSANLVSFGYLQFNSSGFSSENIFVKGNSYPLTTTLNIVNWNMEWFGGTQAPTDDDLQQANAKKVMEYLDADIFACLEVVDTVRFGNLVRSLSGGYNYVVSDFTSLAADPADPNFPTNYATGQKLALVYKTSEVSNVTARGLLRSSSNPNNYSNWSSGRYPFLVNADVTKNGETNNLNFILLHAKANTGTTSQQIDAYNRRKAGVQEMKDTLDANFNTSKVIILGDYNDDLDRTIAPTTGADTVSSYQVLIIDSTDADHYKALTLPLSLFGLHSTAGNPDMIDHVVISNELEAQYLDWSATLFNDIDALAAITDYSNTTSDHYPVMTRFVFGTAASPLPVKLINFNAAKENKNVKLTWSTTQEKNSKEFAIERSTNGIDFQKIGTVTASGSTNTVSNYQFTDMQPNSGNNFYRLRSVDIDNKYELSKVLKINFAKAYTFSITPNPASTNVTVTITNRTEPLKLQIADANGRIVRTQNITTQTTIIDVSNLSKGFYTVKITGSTASYTDKLIIQ